jgi:hypothetical protein
MIILKDIQKFVIDVYKEAGFSIKRNKIVPYPKLIAGVGKRGWVNTISMMELQISAHDDFLKDMDIYPNVTVSITSPGNVLLQGKPVGNMCEPHIFSHTKDQIKIGIANLT